MCMIFVSLEPANTRSEDRTSYRTQHTHIFLVARRVAQLFHIAGFIQCTCIGSMIDETSQHVCRVFKNIAPAPQSFLHLMSCRNLLGLPDRRLSFPDLLETEPGIPCIDLCGGGWFGPVAKQSPLTGYEPNNLIEISNQHTPINFPSRRNRVSVPTSTACPPLPRPMPQTLLDAGKTPPLITQE